MNKAAVVAGGTSKDIGGLADVANRMGAELPLSAQDSADAMVQMASAGASVGKIKKQFPAIAQAATATGDQLQATATVVQNSMNIWGKSLKSPSQAAAILTKTANLSNASISDMQQALATIGGTASNAGMSMQDTTESIGLLTNKGFSAAQAAQDLNHALVQMQAPSGMAAKQMKALNLTFTDSSGKLKPMKQILSETSAALDGLKPAQRTAALKKMFGSSGMAAIIPLMENVKNTTDDTATSWDAYADDVDKATSSAGKSTKFLSDQAKEMQQNMGSKIEQVGGNWESLSNTAMEAKGGVTGSILDMTNKTLEWATKSDSGLAKVTRGFIGLSPVIGPALTAMGGVVKNIVPIANVAGKAGKGLLSVGKGAASAGSKLLGIGKNGSSAAQGVTGLGKAAGPAASGANKVGAAAGSSAKNLLAMGTAVLEVGAGIGLAAAGIGVMVLAISQLAKTGTIGVVAMAAVTVAIAALAAVFAVLGPALTAGALGIGVFGAAVLAIGVGIGVATAGIAALLTSMQGMEASIGSIVPMMTAIGVGFASMIVGFVTTMTTNAPLISAAFVNMILSFLTTLTTAIPQIAQLVLTMITSFLTVIANNIGQIIAAGTALIVNFLEGITESIPQIVPAAVNLIVEFIETIAGQLNKIINAAVDLIGAFVIGLANAMPKIAKKAVAAVEAFAYGVGSALRTIVTSGGKIISSFIQGITGQKHRVNGAGSSILGALSGAFKGFSLAKVGSKIIDGFVGGLRGAWEAGKKFVGGIAKWIKDHKGPIQYDRKLLIGNGQAIMNGLNDGLIDTFHRVVQPSVTNMADAIASAATPSISMDDVSGSINTANKQMKQGLTANVGDISADNRLVIEVPENLDGKEIARVVVEPLEKEQNRRKRMSNLRKGYV